MRRRHLRHSAPLLFVAACLLPAPLRADERAVSADPPPRWWKGNLHTHTLWSDGDDFPEMVAEWYREQGYHFLALSDHNTLSQGQKWMPLFEIQRRAGDAPFNNYLARFGASWVETRRKGDTGPLEVRLKPLGEFRTLVEERDRFLLIQGEEITDNFVRVEKLDKLPVHLNATNLLETIKPQGGDSVAEVIENNVRAVDAQAKRTGQEILPHLNHPNFHYAVAAEDLARAVSEQFFEVYNGHPEVHQPGDAGHLGVERAWDVAISIRLQTLGAAPLFGLANDDSHNYHVPGQNRSLPGRGWVMVRARHLSPESLIRSIRAGDFYASSGVTLNEVRYSAADGTIELEIAPDGDATFTTAFVGTPAGVHLASAPATTADGKPAPAAERYSADVGKTFVTVEGLRPRYRLTGGELYVRAVVTSSKAPDRPSFDGQRKQAWTQPVGWEKRLGRR